MKRLCFFTTFFDFTRKKLLDYYEYALGKKAKLFLFSGAWDINNFKLKKFKKYGFKSSKYLVAFELRRFLKKNNIDYVINFTGGGDTELALLFATLFTKTKIITHIHGNFFWRKESLKELPFLFYALKFNLKHIPLFITQFFTKKFLICSEDIKAKLEKYFSFNKHKFFYLPSAINTRFYRPKDKEKCRKLFGFKKEDKIIIYVGRLSYLKGSDTLFELIKRNSDKKFLLIGSIIDKNFKNIDKKFKNVIYIPKAVGKTLIDYYNTADLFLFLSRTEGNSLAAREAMSCGIPAIVADIESVRLYSPPAIKVPRDINLIQKKIERYFKMPKKYRERLGKESRKFIIKNYSYVSLKKNFQEYFLS